MHPRKWWRIIGKWLGKDAGILFGRSLGESDEMMKLAQLCWANFGAHVFEGISTIDDGRHDLVGMADRWIGDCLVL